MQTFVRIKEGTYKEDTINGVFPLVSEVKDTSKGWSVTIDGTKDFGRSRMSIRVQHPDHAKAIEVADGVTPEEVAAMNDEDVISIEAAVAAATPQVTDEELLEEINDQFEILEKMTDAVARGRVNGLIVSGGPGLGKSHGVEKVLRDYVVQAELASLPCPVDFVKGSMKGIGLYQTLYNNKNHRDVIVFDDTDSILDDEECLNMLKTVLDTGEKRCLSYRKNSAVLKKEGIPQSFEFNGAIIFITNVDFRNERSKKKAAHLEAIMSRCHYIDVGLRNTREKFLRINQVIEQGLLKKYDLEKGLVGEIIDFMQEHADNLREISLRTVLKIADLIELVDALPKKKKGKNHTWRQMAKTTTMFK